MNQLAIILNSKVEFLISKGVHRSWEYIATQAPMQNTIGEFWRLVWEQKVELIVMLTNLNEAGQVYAYK